MDVAIATDKKLVPVIAKQWRLDLGNARRMEAMRKNQRQIDEANDLASVRTNATSLLDQMKPYTFMGGEIMRKMVVLIVMMMVSCCGWTMQALADDVLNADLFGAIHAGDTQKVKTLIAQGADVSIPFGNIPFNVVQTQTNVVDPVSSTPLSDALIYEHKEIARILASHMTRFLTPFTWGNGSNGMDSALETTVMENDPDIFKILIQRGASIAKAQAAGINLYRNVESTTMADLLLSNGADVNFRMPDWNNQTALHIQASRGTYPAVIQWLLTHGTDVNAKDNKGNTPLMVAVQYGNVDVSKELIAYGANIGLENENGKTALQLTEQINDMNKRTAMIALLKSEMQKEVKEETPHGKNRRQTFKALLAKFNGDHNNDILRETIISLALKLRPAPAIPREAHRHLNRGTAAFVIAKSPSDFKDAVSEFQQAADIAPWWAAPYYNIGKSEQQAGDDRAAAHAFKFYLLAAPHAKDAQATQDLIDQLGYIADKQAKEQQALAARQNWARNLVAEWNMSYGGIVFHGYTTFGTVSLVNPDSADWHVFLNDNDTSSSDLRNENKHFIFHVSGNKQDEVKIAAPLPGNGFSYCLDYEHRNAAFINGNSGYSGYRVHPCANTKSNFSGDEWISFSTAQSPPGSPWIQILTDCQNGTCGEMTGGGGWRGGGQRYVLSQ